MRDWLATLAALCRLPMQGGFAELDEQISKLRILRDSYQNSSKANHEDAAAKTSTCGKQTCMP
jgi:hypothetical protein